jgi:hypothetical protein
MYQPEVQGSGSWTPGEELVDYFLRYLNFFVHHNPWGFAFLCFIGFTGMLAWILELIILEFTDYDD